MTTEAHTPEIPSSTVREAATMRGLHSTTRESPLLATTRESLHAAVKIQYSKLKKKHQKNSWGVDCFIQAA